jgi:hypothetical protein
VHACRNCCLEVLVLAAEMTGKKRWGEAYQRQHSIDYMCVSSCEICYAGFVRLLEDALWVPLRSFLQLHT